MANRVDKSVSTLVNKNKEEFYRVNPWLRPPESHVEEKPWYEKTWDWLCGKGEALVEGAKKAWNWIGDIAKKAWDGLVEFYQEHKKIIDTVLIVVGAVAAIAAVVVMGGLALVPLLGAIGVSTATAITISTAVAVVAVVSTLVSSTMNVVDIWCEIDNPIFNTFQKAVNIISTVSNIIYLICSVYNSIKGITPQQYIASHPVETSTYTSVDQMSKTQIQAFEDYMRDDYYRNINNSLRGKEMVTPDNAQRINVLRDTLDNSSLSQDMTLYRGTIINALDDMKNLPPEELIGKPFTEKAFMSMSTSKHVGDAFSYDMELIINASKGSHALDIASLSGYPESEILFSAGQEMIITGAEKIKGVLYLTVDIIL